MKVTKEWRAKFGFIYIEEDSIYEWKFFRYCDIEEQFYIWELDKEIWIKHHAEIKEIEEVITIQNNAIDKINREAGRIHD